MATLGTKPVSTPSLIISDFYIIIFKLNANKIKSIKINNTETKKEAKNTRFHSDNMEGNYLGLESYPQTHNSRNRLIDWLPGFLKITSRSH